MELDKLRKQEKASILAAEQKTVCMIGDGVNDAPTVKTIKFSITLSMCINFLAVTLSVSGNHGIAAVRFIPLPLQNQSTKKPESVHACLLCPCQFLHCLFLR